MVEVMVQEVPGALTVVAGLTTPHLGAQTKTHLANLGKGTVAGSTGKGAVVGYDRRGQAIVQRGWKSVDEVLATIRARHPEPVDQGPNSMEILRAEREARDQQLNHGR